MRRREFITLIGGGAATLPLTVRAQQRTQKIPRIGWLAPGTRENYEPLLEEYRRGMLELGYAEGRTIETEYLYADAQLDRLPALAQRLVEHKVDVIVTVSTPPTLRPSEQLQPSRSCLLPAPTRLKPAWSQASLAPAAMPLAYRSCPRS